MTLLERPAFSDETFRQGNIELSQQKLNFYPCMQLSKNDRGVCFSKPRKVCGADRARTDDIQLAKLALSQLSYSPEWRGLNCPVEGRRLEVEIEEINFRPPAFDFRVGVWAWVDSNHRPHAYQACALTS